MAALHTCLSSSSSVLGDVLSSSSFSASSTPQTTFPSRREEKLLLLPCGPLLDMLWEGTRSGNPVVQQVYRQLVDACAHVFIFQVGCLIK